MKSITARQQEVLTFIDDFSKENNYPPTFREISAHFGISLRAVQDHVAALQKKGFLMHTSGKSRTLKSSVANPLEMVIKKKKSMLSAIQTVKTDSSLLEIDNEKAISYIMNNPVAKAQLRDYFNTVYDINSCYDGKTVSVCLDELDNDLDVFEFSDINGSILGLRKNITEREKELYKFARDCYLVNSCSDYPDADGFMENECYEYLLLPEEEVTFISYENQRQKFLNQDFSEMI